MAGKTKMDVERWMMRERTLEIGKIASRPAVGVHTRGGGSMRACRIPIHPIFIVLSTICLLAGSPSAARGGIEKFIDDRTVLAGEADLTRVDADAIGKWAADTFKTAHLIAPEGPGPTGAELRGSIGQFKRWLADVKAQGATVVYLIASDDVGPGKPF